EKRGLVYAVESNLSLMSNAGLFMIYFGTDPSNVDKCRKIIASELEKAAMSRLSDRMFDKIKRQYRGQLVVSSERKEGRIMTMARGLLFTGELRDVRTQMEGIMAVTSEDMRMAAEMIVPAKCSTLTLI
ncbi:MAG: insulinase family protein, partial [Muribaculaceae bacterium]|nr:insulinase family protein [Muribaculaceae bacterium]